MSAKMACKPSASISGHPPMDAVTTYHPILVLLKQSDRRLNHRLELIGSAIDHLAGDVEDDCQADIGDPAVLLEQPRNYVGRDAHQGDREEQAKDEHNRMLARRPCDC